MNERTANGSMEPETKVLTKSPPTLEEAQKFVGGLVEIVYLMDGAQMLVNEEGLLMELPVNPMASVWAGKLIVGNALVLDEEAKWE